MGNNADFPVMKQSIHPLAHPRFDSGVSKALRTNIPIGTSIPANDKKAFAKNRNTDRSSNADGKAIPRTTTLIIIINPTST
jgi:hypothetical protein